MTDNDIIKVFLPLVNTQLTAGGFTNVTVLQSNQPTQQGVPYEPTAYFYKVDNRRYGWEGLEDEWDSDTQTMVRTERQWIEATYRMSVLALQNVSDTDTYTASDIANEIASILQSYTARTTFSEAGIGILRVTAVSNQYFPDDRDQFEAIPGFDFVFTYEQTRVSEGVPIDEYGDAIYRV